jgi:hypothetical protein
MPKEIKPDGDLRFEGFASFPNSAAFSGDSGMLEYAENIEINEGVITPRLGSAIAGNAGSAVEYACSAHGPSGDSILLWGANKRFNCQSGTFTNLNLAAKQKARGNGYADAITMETTDTDWVTGGYITERLVTAKDDRIRFTLYTGVAPYEPDDLRLVQGTYDPIQAIVPSMNSMLAFGKRSIYAVKAGMGRQAIIDRKPSREAFHETKKISGSEGLIAKDGWAENGGYIAFMDVDGIKMMKGDEFVEGSAPISYQIQNIIDLIDPAKIADITAVGLRGRLYFSLPLLGSYNKTCVLVMNTGNKGMFESLHVYPVSMDFLCLARKNGIVRLWGVNKANGTVHLLEEGSTDAGTAIQATIRTRNYFMQSHSDKKYDDCYLYLDTRGSASLDMNFISVNPDGKWTIDTFNGNLGTAVRRALANKKCMGGKLEIVVKSGNPAIFSLGVEGSLVGRSIFSSF